MVVRMVGDGSGGASPRGLGRGLVLGLATHWDGWAHGCREGRGVGRVTWMSLPKPNDNR